MIPKIIHYCWFGKGEKNNTIKNCIGSWKKAMPDYEIIEWSEENFNCDFNMFVKEAYSQKKWAFVSDVARLWALYNYGGIYMDTDVEVYKPLDEFLNEPAFSGFEQAGYPVCATVGAEKHNKIIKQMLEYYDDKEFKYNSTDWRKNTTNTMIMSDILADNGINRNKNELQRIENFTIYPQKIFMEEYTKHFMLGSWC